MTDTAADISTLSFEQALAELEKIVSELESGQAPLERSIDIYERGAALKAHCEKKLEAARLKVEKIVVGGDGQALRAERTEVPGRAEAPVDLRGREDQAPTLGQVDDAFHQLGVANGCHRQSRLVARPVRTGGQSRAVERSRRST